MVREASNKVIIVLPLKKWTCISCIVRHAGRFTTIVVDRCIVLHAYLPGPNNSTIRHHSGNGEVHNLNIFIPYSFLTRMQPVIDYEQSRKYPETWQAMEKLVDSGKAKSVGTLKS